MHNINIHYIATKKYVIQALKDYCSAQGINLIQYEPELWSEIRNLLIVEPVEIGTDLFALSTIWKPWLMEHRPEIKLFFAGFAESTHQNYLNLLELPDALAEWFENGNSVGAYPLQYAGVIERNDRKYDKYNDPWNRLLPLTGRDMKKQMKKFTDGHDRSSSFFVQVSRLRKSLVDIRFLLQQNPGDNITQSKIDSDLSESRKDAIEEWGYLRLRWDFYKKYFDSMPFTATTKKIYEIMKDLEKCIDNIDDSSTVINPTLIDDLINW
jgi:hypothetical protein